MGTTIDFDIDFDLDFDIDFDAGFDIDFDTDFDLSLCFCFFEKHTKAYLLLTDAHLF